MSVRTVTGEINYPDGSAWSGGKVVFYLEQTGFETGEPAYGVSEVSVTCGTDGTFSQDLWVNEDSEVLSIYRCKTPDGQMFRFILPNGAGSIDLGDLRVNHSPDDVPAQSPAGFTSKADRDAGNIGSPQAPLWRTAIELGNVDNTSDVNKPVSTAQQTALNLKADKTATNIGATEETAWRTALSISNVDNTSDVNKPVSTAQQTALNLKANSADVPPNARTISAGTGLTGGGDLSANRTIALNAGSIASLLLADSALQSLPTTNTAWVSKGGNDGTGEVGRADLPFLTVTAAQSAATVEGVVISDAGTTLLDGEYSYIGTFTDGKREYQLDGGPSTTRIYWSTADLKWYLETATGIFYQSISDTVYPWEATWSVGALGSAPVPSVDKRFAPTILVLPGDYSGETALAGKDGVTYQGLDGAILPGFNVTTAISIKGSGLCQSLICNNAGAVMDMPGMDTVTFIACSTGTQTAGNVGTFIECFGGTQTAGNAGTIIACEGGTQTAGNAGASIECLGGTQTAGNAGTSIACEGGTQTAGNAGTYIYCQDSTQTAGNAGTFIQCLSGTQTAGNAGSYIRCDGGTQTAGNAGSYIRCGSGTQIIRLTDQSHDGTTYAPIQLQGSGSLNLYGDTSTSTESGGTVVNIGAGWSGSLFMAGVKLKATTVATNEATTGINYGALVTGKVILKDVAIITAQDGTGTAEAISAPAAQTVYVMGTLNTTHDVDANISLVGGDININTNFE